MDFEETAHDDDLPEIGKIRSPVNRGRRRASGNPSPSRSTICRTSVAWHLEAGSHRMCIIVHNGTAASTSHTVSMRHIEDGRCLPTADMPRLFHGEGVRDKRPVDSSSRVPPETLRGSPMVASTSPRWEPIEPDLDSPSPPSRTRAQTTRFLPILSVIFPEFPCRCSAA